jgi:hypothetical protein
MSTNDIRLRQASEWLARPRSERTAASLAVLLAQWEESGFMLANDRVRNAVLLLTSTGLEEAMVKRSTAK